MTKDEILEYELLKLEDEFIDKLHEITEDDVYMILNKSLDEIFDEVEDFVFEEMYSLIEKGCNKKFIKKMLDNKIESTIKEFEKMIYEEIGILSDSEKIKRLIKKYRKDIYILELTDILSIHYCSIYEFINDCVNDKISELKDIANSVLNSEILN